MTNNNELYEIERNVFGQLGIGNDIKTHLNSRKQNAYLTKLNK